jgi:hypothetical protein
MDKPFLGLCIERDVPKSGKISIRSIAGDSIHLHFHQPCLTYKFGRYAKSWALKLSMQKDWNEAREFGSGQQTFTTINVRDKSARI